MPGDETGPITKDPRRKGFWTVRNIGGLLVLASMSAGAPGTIDAVKAYHALHDRMGDHEDWRGEMEKNINDQAYWHAFADVNNKIRELDVRLRAMMKLFDREFGRGAGDVAKVMEQDLADLHEARAQIEALHEQLKTLIAHYKKDHPDVPDINDLPPPAVQKPLTPEEIRRMIEQAQTTQQVIPAANQFKGENLKVHYEKRNPKK